MSDKLLESKTNIKTGTGDEFLEKELIFMHGQTITIHLPLKVLDIAEASLVDLHDAAVKRAIDLLQGMLDRGE